MSEDFNSEVLAWGKLALEKDPFLDFDGLVRALPGVHPNDVAKIFGHQQTGIERVTPQKAHPSDIDAPDELPVPHPLDFDWRFSSASTIAISERASLLTPSKGTIALLGVPTLFGQLRRNRSDTRLLLVDASIQTISALSLKFGSEHFLVCDLLSGSLPAMTADVVIADPPWYPKFFESFLWSATQILRIGGSLLLCGPNHGTRPGAKAEWEQIKDFARVLGFELSELDSSIRYDTPPFERNALKAAGHPMVSSDWRTGCLATFVRSRMVTTERKISEFDASRWEDHSVNGVRWRVRCKGMQEFIRPLLQQLVPGDILDSVSRRDLRRSQVDLWSSGNRIFRCSDTYAVNLILEALAAGASSVTFVETSIGRQLNRSERAAVEAAEHQLRSIITAERNEYLGAVEDLSVI